MSFFRAFVDQATGAICHIVEQSVPFEGGGIVTSPGAAYEAHDLGLVIAHPWTDAAGKPATPAEHVYSRLKGLPLGLARQMIVERADMPTFLDCPCTLDGIKARLRAGGPASLPVTARAWLAAVLPPDRAAAMGLSRGLPVSVRKAVEALRNRRDPHGGSRLPELAAKAQNQANGHAQARLRSRHSKTKASTGGHSPTGA